QRVPARKRRVEDGEVEGRAAVLVEEERRPLEHLLAEHLDDVRGDEGGAQRQPEPELAAAAEAEEAEADEDGGGYGRGEEDDPVGDGRERDVTVVLGRVEDRERRRAGGRQLGSRLGRGHDVVERGLVEAGEGAGGDEPGERSGEGGGEGSGERGGGRPPGHGEEVWAEPPDGARA